MSCQGKPISTTPTTACEHWQCHNSNTGSNCVPMVFVFAPHWIKNGFVLPGASGGFVPAATVCQVGIITERIGRAQFEPSYPYFGI